MAQISLNPVQTTGFSDSFVVSTEGYVQGTALPDPGLRYQLEGGIVATGQATPIWGGLPLSLAVPNVGQNSQGPAASVATTLLGINAWSTFDQASNGIITPTSNVPLYASGQSVNFYRAGSNLRFVLPVENTTVLNALEGAAPNVDLYWDTTNLCLTTTSGAGYLGPLPIQLEDLSATSKTVSYNSGTNMANWIPDGPVAVVRI